MALHNVSRVWLYLLGLDLLGDQVQDFGHACVGDAGNNVDGFFRQFL